MAIEKRSAADAARPALVAAAAGVLGQLAPALIERLTCKAFADGTPRKVDTVLLFEQDGVWKCMLKDREANLCLWVSSAILDDLPEVLEAAVTDPAAVWRADRAAGATEATRQKPKK